MGNRTSFRFGRGLNTEKIIKSWLMVAIPYMVLVGIMRYVERPLYSGESVLIPRKGTLNNVMYVNGAFWSVDTMFYTKMQRPNVAKFVFHFIKSKDLASLNDWFCCSEYDNKHFECNAAPYPTMKRHSESLKNLFYLCIKPCRKTKRNPQDWPQ